VLSKFGFDVSQEDTKLYKTAVQVRTNDLTGVPPRIQFSVRILWSDGCYESAQSHRMTTAVLNVKVTSLTD